MAPRKMVPKNLFAGQQWTNRHREQTYGHGERGGEGEMFRESNMETYIAAAAKSPPSCPTPCDPIDGSPPGSPSMGFSRQEYWSGVPLPSPETYITICKIDGQREFAVWLRKIKQGLCINLEG